MATRRRARQRQGSWHRCYTPDDEVRLMRQLYQEHLRLRAEAAKISPRQIAAKFELHTSSLHEILNHVTYTDVI